MEEQGIVVLNTRIEIIPDDLILILCAVKPRPSVRGYKARFST